MAKGKGYGDKDMMAGGKGMSPRKAMAGGDEGGDFGVKSFAEANRQGPRHADAVAGTGRMPPMADHERGIGESVHHTKRHHPAQAAPDHGPTHPGGHHMDHYAEKA